MSVTGASSSTTVKVVEQVAVLPAVSVTRPLAVWDPRPKSPSTKSVKTAESMPQLSLPVGLERETAPAHSVDLVKKVAV